MTRNVRAPQGMTDTLTAQWGVLFNYAIRAICHLPHTWSCDFYTGVRFESAVNKFILLMHLHLKVS